MKIIEFNNETHLDFQNQFGYITPFSEEELIGRLRVLQGQFRMGKTWVIEGEVEAFKVAINKVRIYNILKRRTCKE